MIPWNLSTSSWYHGIWVLPPDTMEFEYSLLIPWNLSTPSVPNYLSVLIGTQILRNLWGICENTQLGSNPSLNELSNELIYTQTGIVNPYKSLRPKIGRLLFGQLEWKRIIFFQFFLLNEWTTYFTSFPWTPSTSNSNSVWARGEFLLKTRIKLIFPVFSEELLHAAMWLKLLKGWKAGC
jgi:hypothetical protein